MALGGGKFGPRSGLERLARSRLGLVGPWRRPARAAAGVTPSCAGGGHRFWVVTLARKEEKAPRERPRQVDLDEKAMLEQDQALIEQLQRREPREAVRKKPPTPPKAGVAWNRV